MRRSPQDERQANECRSAANKRDTNPRMLESDPWVAPPRNQEKSAAKDKPELQLEVVAKHCWGDDRYEGCSQGSSGADRQVKACQMRGTRSQGIEFPVAHDATDKQSRPKNDDLGRRGKRQGAGYGETHCSQCNQQYWSKPPTIIPFGIVETENEARQIECKRHHPE